jgi:4-amino-4-deoxy-L-arabinose transferase-like glycosyltransferase
MNEHRNPAPKHLSRTSWIVIALLTALILSPILFFPLGHDEAIFFVSGEKILQGALPYRDFIDIKPPFIYYLYAVAIAIFGHGDASIRILDFMLQGATIWLLVGLIRKASENDLWAAIAAVLYAIVYVGLSPAGTAQTESYVGLLGLGMIWLQLYRRTPVGIVALGFLGGLLIMFKVTFGIVLAGTALAEIIIFEKQYRVRNLMLMASGAAIVGMAFMIMLMAFDLVADFRIMQEYTKGYAAQQWTSIGGWLKDFSKKTPPYIADNYSIMLSLATVAGMVYSVIPYRSSDRNRMSADGERLLQLCTIMVILLLFSIGVEQKYAAYHFGRFYAFGVVLASWGGLAAARSFSNIARVRSGYRWFIGLVVAVMLLLFSPLTRYLWHSGAAVISITRGSAALDNYYDQSVVGYTRSEMRQIGNYIIAHRRPGDRLFVASGFAGLMYRFANTIPDFKLYHGTTFTAIFAPEPWKRATSDYILHHRPLDIVAQFNDGFAPLNGTPLSAEEGMRVLPGIDSLMRSSYTRVMQTEGFNLYELKH